MKSLLPADKLSLTRLEKAIERISISGILLVGVDTLNLSNEFEKYLVDTHSLKVLDIQSEILSNIAYDNNIDKKEFFLVNIFDKENQQEMINHLQFQRDFIPEKGIKIVMILSNEMLEYLKINAGDLFSTVKFSYSFIDHSFDFMLEVKDDKLNKSIKEYEDYLKLETKHDDILCELTTNIAENAEKISEFHLSLEYYQIALNYAKNKIQKANILNEIGSLYNNLSDNQTALKHHNKALKIYQQLKNKIGLANCFTRIGNAYNNFGKLNIDLKYQKDALKIFREMKNQSGIATSFNNIGTIYQNLGDFETALKYHNDSLKIKQEIGNKAHISISLNNIGNIYQGLGDFETALKYHNDSLIMKKESGNKYGIANSLGNIGIIYQNTGELETALKYHNDSLAIQKEIGDKSGIANLLNNIGTTYQELKDFKKALNYQNDSLAIQKDIGDKSGIANNLGNIGIIYQELEELETALKYHNDSLKIFKEIGDKSSIANTLNSLGVTYLKLKDYKTALKYLNDSLKIAKENKYIIIEAEVLKDIADTDKEQNNIKESKKNYLLSKHLYEAMGLTKKIEEIDIELKKLS